MGHAGHRHRGHGGGHRGHGGGYRCHGGGTGAGVELYSAYCAIPLGKMYSIPQEFISVSTFNYSILT
jgi:hypothetical protein